MRRGRCHRRGGRSSGRSRHRRYIGRGFYDGGCGHLPGSLDATTRRNSPRSSNTTRRTTATYAPTRSEEHTSELQSLMRISYAVFCLKKKNNQHKTLNKNIYTTQEKGTLQQNYRN